MRLSERAMGIRLSISQWTGKIKDVTATNEICETYQVDKDRASAIKALVPESELKIINKAANEIRQFHYFNSLPWDNYGIRLLPSTNYIFYTEKMRVHKANFESKVSAFIEKYPSLVEQSQEGLGALFNRSEYPSRERIAQKFGVFLEVQPIPDKDDFRVNLSNEQVELIKNTINQDVEEKFEVAMKDSWKRLFIVVKNVLDKFSNVGEDDIVFRDSLIMNIRDVCQVIPRLNIAEDENLTRITSEIEMRLASLDPQNLRKSTEARNHAASTANEIIEKMQAYM